MLCFPLDIHKMLGVLYVSTWLFQGLCKSRSEGPSPKTETAEVTAAVANWGPGSRSSPPFGRGLRRGVGSHRIVVGSESDEVIAGAMASAVFLSKSEWFQPAARRRLAGRCFAVAANRQQPGGLFPAESSLAGKRGPTTLWTEIGRAGLQARVRRQY